MNELMCSAGMPRPPCSAHKINDVAAELSITRNFAASL